MALVIGTPFVAGRASTALWQRRSLQHVIGTLLSRPLLLKIRYSSSEKTSRRFFQVSQFRAVDGLGVKSNNNHDADETTAPSSSTSTRRQGREVTIYSSDKNSTHWTTTTTTSLLREDDHEKKSNKSWRTSSIANNLGDRLALQQYLFENVIKHFLPAHYPHSVSHGYARFSLLAFSASAAGSAAMVLSTQTLLLAVGVLGSANSHNASILAGALNWVLKDGIGQLGGVIFASRMGQTKKFDSDPKRWRMIAALCLDGASLLEILSPLILASWVLPLACTANIGKNIGFLTASASRAAIHQSLALQGNLADVTAKSATQSMAAGLLGTAIGIGLSTSVLHHDAGNFIVGVCILSAIHQGCNYWSLKYVPLRHFNRHRLHLLLTEYCLTTNHHDVDTYSQSTSSSSSSRAAVVLTPSQVARREQYFPLAFSSPDDSHSWLSIGNPLDVFCQGSVDDFEQVYQFFENKKEAYLLNIMVEGGTVDLVFQQHATGDDVIKGMYHAYQLRSVWLREGASQRNGMLMTAKSYQTIQERFPLLQEELHKNGWMTGTDVTNIEPNNGYRLSIETRE
jgi:Vitamin B6 photo-protection and homoeostasis